LRYEGPSIHNDHRVISPISNLQFKINIARIEYVTWLLTLKAKYDFLGGYLLERHRLIFLQRK